MQSSYKVKQHLKFYGLWDSKKSIEGPSTAKKSRINESDSSTNSDSSDSERLSQITYSITCQKGLRGLGLYTVHGCLPMRDSIHGCAGGR